MARNIRVYMLARELDIKSKEVLTILQEEMNLEVNNHMTAVNNQVADRVRRIVRGEEDAEDQETPDEAAEASDELVEAKPEPIPDSRRPRDAKKDRQPPDRRDRSRRQPSSGLRVPVDHVTLSGSITVADLAEKLKVDAMALMQHLVGMGIMANINQELDVESAALIVGELGVDFDYQEEPEDEDEVLLEYVDEPDPDQAVPRAPVVTVMGHVDHGKTTLLDTIRHTAIAEREAGGITQHIGASTVHHDGKAIVFLDTPGHEAFTAMRARGAQVTDMVVLIVAADDGVMPQTLEAVDHAKEAGVSMIVAVNKIELPNAQPDRIRQELSGHDLVPEEWGGDTVYVDISALTGDNVDDLLDMIILMAEMEQLTADPTQKVHGVIIEAELDRGRGPVATVLVQAGTLRRGTPFVAGIYSGRVRALFNDRGETIDEAGPSTPVEVLGSSGVPEAGDLFVQMESDSEARSLSQTLQEEAREQELQPLSAVSLEEFYEQEGRKELKIVLKADVHGSLEACARALERIENEEVSVRVIHGGVGAITESDMMLASASDAVVIGFNVRPNARARDSASEQGLDVRTYRVIYELLEDVEAAITGMLAPRYRERTLGRAEVRETFQVSGTGTIAGLYVTEGMIRRRARVRLVRDGRVVHEGRIGSLKRFQDDAREVASGYECGLGLENFNDVHVGDEIEVYVVEEVARG